MGTVLKSKKGFSMLEMLACIFIISALMLVSLSNTNSLNLDHYKFLNEYELKQSLSLLNREYVDVSGNVYFNNMGHINQARTIEFDNHRVIIHLGNGYASVE